jgi:hypothetical protein
MGLDPSFIGLNGFTTYQSQLGAVGGTGFAGMNGAMGGGGAGVGMGMGAGGPFGPSGRPETGTYAAGDYPFSSSAIAPGLPEGGLRASQDAFDQASERPQPARASGFDAARPSRPDQRGIVDAGRVPSIRGIPRSKIARRQAARKPTRGTTRTKAPRR